jgi:hypothetical protein
MPTRAEWRLNGPEASAASSSNGERNRSRGPKFVEYPALYSWRKAIDDEHDDER